MPATTVSDPDRFPLEVLATILSGQGGRLFVELRDKRGLAYRVSAFSVEGVDPDGVYRVEIEGKPTRHLIPRVVRTIQALLSKRSDAAVASGLRAQAPGTTRFLDLSIVGEQDRFVERTIRITRLPAAETAAARAAIRAAIPPRTGRVI